MKSLFKYLKNYKKEVILAPVLKMTEAGFELFVPKVIAAIVDEGINKNNPGFVLKMGFVLLALAIVGLICALTAQYFAAKAATGFAYELRKGLFEHIQGLSFSEYDTMGTSTLITRMTSDVNQLQNGVNMVLRLLLRSPIVVFGAMIMSFTVNVKAAFIFVVAVPLLAVVVIVIMAITIPLYKKVQSRLDTVLRKTRENLTGVRVIRAFGSEEKEIDNYNEETDGLFQAQMFVGRISAVMGPATFIIVNAATIILIRTGAIQVNEGIIEQGMLIALVNYMAQILVELIKLANLIVLVTKAFASAGRIENILDTKSSMQMTENNAGLQNGADETYTGKETAGGEYLVEFDNVYFKYDDASDYSLQGINFKVKEGQTVGIIGGTGSGKTSVVNLIPRFYDTALGEVRIDGKNVKDYDINKLRNMIGFVLQKAVLFKGTIKSNLLWGNENATEEELINALKVSQSYDFVFAEKEGIDRVVEQGGKNFSGGQRQRLTIARAVVRKPRILILDDSSSALDYATELKLRNELKNINTTAFIISQRTSSIMHADLIIVLDDGEMVGRGTHEELLNTCDVYREIYESQNSKN